MATTTHLPLLIFFILILLIHAKLNLHPTDHQALSTILQDLNFYGNPENLCNIAGISCHQKISNNSYTLKVIGIVFKTHRITEFLSPAMGQLSELKELSISDNYLTGSIPPEIANCRNIEVINLKKNKLPGEVPAELSHLLRLRILDLSFNKFSGNLGFLKYFPNLENLSLENNMFTGKVPVSLRLFRNLRFFNVSGNGLLEGPFPELSRLESSSPELESRSYKRVPKRYKFAESTNRTENNAPAPVEAAGQKRKENSRKKIMGWVLGFFAGSIAGLISAMIITVLIKLVSIGDTIHNASPTLGSSPNLINPAQKRH